MGNRARAYQVRMKSRLVTEREEFVQRQTDGAHKWQKPLMNLALYIMSAAISILLYLYIVSKNLMSSSLLVVTEVDGGSIL